MKQKISAKGGSASGRKSFSYWLGVIVVGIALGLALQFVRAWTEPTQAPPGGNLGAPINTGGLAQIKGGPLGINAEAVNPIGLVVQGNVKVGTLAPTAPAPNGQPGNLDANDVFLRSVNEWASQIPKCIRKRSKATKWDSVVWCTSDYPIMFSCNIIDNETPNQIYDPIKYAPNCDGGDEECDATGLRTNLGTDNAYMETVVNSKSGVEGCWQYDHMHKRRSYRLDLMCCAGKVGGTGNEIIDCPSGSTCTSVGLGSPSP